MKNLLTSILVLFISNLGLSQTVSIIYESGSGNCDGQAVFVDSTSSVTTWNWLDQDTVTVLQVDGDTISGLCSGVFFIVYNSGVDTLTYTISTNPCIGFSMFVDNISQSIPGSCDGQAGSLLYGGTAPFAYQWGAAANYQTSEIIDDLCSGWYTLSVTDALGCELYDSTFVDVDTNFSSCYAFFYNQLNNNGEMEFYSYATAGSTYYWDFGDGNSSTLQNPVHTYSSPGIYQVQFVLTDPDGCSSSRGKFIDATPPTTCDAYFISINDSVDQTLIYLVNLTVGADSIQYSWNMDDGSVYNTELPYHTFAGSGPYNICLTITDGDSCVSTFCRNVESFAKSGSFTILVVEPGNTAPMFASLNNIEKQGEILIFPNPTNGIISVSSTSDNAIDNIEVFDILGNFVRRENTTSANLNVDLQYLSSGIYFVKVELENNETFVSKIVVE